MVRSALRTAGVVLAALAVVAACGDDTEEVDAGAPVTSDPGSAPLEGTQWVLDLGALGADPSVSATGTLRLEAGTASGTTGCNSFTGGYSLEGDTLTFEALATTEMACEPALMEIEQAVLDGLAATESYAIAGETLTLEGADGPVLTYQAGTGDALLGDWVVTGYLTADASAFTSLEAGTEATVTFADDGTVSGSSGCNTFNGGYTLEGDTIDIGPLGSTRMACDPPSVMDQEAAILAALESATTWVLTANGLELSNAEGMRVLGLAPAG